MQPVVINIHIEKFVDRIEAPQGGRASEVEIMFNRLIKQSLASNIQTRCNCQEKDFVLNFSSDPHSQKLRQEKDLIEMRKSRLRFLESHGLKYEYELWNGKEINPALIERLWLYQNQIRKQTGGQKTSRTQVYKAMLDAIKWFGFAPC